jgi:hypothetical protein
MGLNLNGLNLSYGPSGNKQTGDVETLFRGATAPGGTGMFPYTPKTPSPVAATPTPSSIGANTVSIIMSHNQLLIDAGITR